MTTWAKKNKLNLVWCCVSHDFAEVLAEGVNGVGWSTLSCIQEDMLRESPSVTGRKPGTDSDIFYRPRYSQARLSRRQAQRSPRAEGERQRRGASSLGTRLHARPQDQVYHRGGYRSMAQEPQGTTDRFGELGHALGVLLLDRADLTLPSNRLRFFPGSMLVLVVTTSLAFPARSATSLVTFDLGTELTSLSRSDRRPLYSHAHRSRLLPDQELHCLRELFLTLLVIPCEYGS